ncbi:MAG: TrkH family potassium uptake protein, partial [Thermoguttaceae bacterium]
IFESISGYSTCGATVLSDVQSSQMIPRSVLFWRAMTHFIGGVGILTILTVLAGQGARRKTVVRAEMVSIVSDKPKVPVYKLAGIVLTIYLSLNLLLTLILCISGVPLFDSLAHAFSTISTGGFSTYNTSVGYFASSTNLNAAFIEYTITLFMLMAGTNFLLYYWVVIGKPGVLFKNEEWRVFIGIYLVASIMILSSGLYNNDFKAKGIGEKTLVEGANPDDAATFSLSTRYVFFTTASIITNTGFATYEYEKWNPFSCFILLTLFFAGGCAGSTSGSIKVIRHIVCWKLIRRKIELTFRPNLVKPIVANGNEMEPETQQSILIFFASFMILFAAMTIFVLALEPASKWTAANLSPENKAIDVASSVAACLSNTGPGLGIVGAKQNYGNFSETSKILFSFAMLLGRLEIFIVLTLFIPNFWRRIPK